MNFEQLKTILWLRWRLTRNQWARGKGIGAVIAAVVALAALVLAGASFLGALLAGIFGFSAAKPVVVMGVWLGLTLAFLFLWMIGLLNEIQRSESIDLQRLLHLPVALGQMFIINYLASHLTLSIVIAGARDDGTGLWPRRSRAAPRCCCWCRSSLGMVFMVTAWTYLPARLAGHADVQSAQTPHHHHGHHDCFHSPRPGAQPLF